MKRISRKPFVRILFAALLVMGLLFGIRRVLAQNTLLVGFQSESVTTNEKVGALKVTVTLNSSSTDTVTVQYATSDGSAVAPDDYIGVSDTLVFPPGTTSLDIWVPIIDDGVSEDTESFSITLSNPQNAALGGSGVCTVTIEDGAGSSPPAATISFEYATYTCNESDGTVTITVLMSGSPTARVVSGVVSVGYATGDGSATAGSDYTATSGTLTWQANEAGTTKSFTVTILDDSIVEGTEVFFVILSSPVNGAIVRYPVAAVNILDDDITCAD
jgi:Calx-beta domain